LHQELEGIDAANSSLIGLDAFDKKPDKMIAEYKYLKIIQKLQRNIE
jgi:hypothetical protein